MPYSIPSTLRQLCAIAIVAVSSIGSIGSIQAAPWVPSDPKQVIETLPRRLDPQQQQLQQMRQQLSREPQNLKLAQDLAQRYIETARKTADPRYLGYAEAALQPWWHSGSAPDSVLILRAILRQSTHQFEAALQDLDTVIKHDPNHAQAWLTRATILQVRGDYAGAKQSCARLFRLADSLVTQTCMQSVASLNGDAANSYRRMQQTLQQQKDVDPALQLWGQTLLGEMAERAGDMRAAEQHFKAALASSPDAAQDSYLLAAWADFLLQQQRSAEVVKLLRDHTRADNLLLRYALALQHQHSPLAKQVIQHLAERFDAAARRGDLVHQREQARFALLLQGDASNALKLAQQNWQVQKEPADARILLQAAVASQQIAAARPVLQWLAQSKLEDQSISRLTRQLGKKPGAA